MGNSPTLFISYVNGPDLLLDAYNSYKKYFDVRILNNSLSPLGEEYEKAEVTNMRVSLTTGQSFNWFRSVAMEEEMKYFFWSHHDCIVTPEQVERTKDYVQSLEDPKWGMVFTAYDVFCAFNTQALREVGGWDTLRFQYYSGDVDLYRRLEEAGWNKHDIGGEGVTHYANATTERDEERLKVIPHISNLEAQLYQHKWDPDFSTQ